MARYIRSVDARLAIRPAAVEARGIEGRWAPTIESFRGVVPAMQSWRLTEKGRAAAETAASTSDSRSITLLGICEPLPPPVLAVFTDLRTIEVRDATVAMRFEGGVGVTK